MTGHAHNPTPPCVCGHTERMHSVLSDGCLAMGCDCEDYETAQFEVDEHGKRALPYRVIPSRATDPPTSHAAESDVRPRAKNQHGRLLAVYGRRVDATDEEAMEGADGISPRACWWKRCSELREAGFIEPTGARRLASSGSERMVCRITDKGRAALRKESLR